MDKTCIIINGPYSYQLKVDGECISFNSNSAADYFEKHYASLGYEVVLDNSYWDDKEV